MTAVAPGPESRSALLRALKTVGVDDSQVLDLAGSIFEGRDAFLVGSLAAGLGNAGSDIDVHVFGEDETLGLMELFLGSRPVEVLQYARDAPASLVASSGPSAIAELRFGRCGLGPAPDRGAQRRLAHWIYGLPFTEGQPRRSILDADQQDEARAALVRGALEETIRCYVTAHVASAAAHRAAPYLWGRMGRWLLEMCVRAADECFVAEKWLPARLARSSVSPAFARRAGAISSEIDARSALGAVALSFDPLDVVRLDRSIEADPIRIGREDFLVVHKRRLVRPVGASPGSVRELIAERGPEKTAQVIGQQELTPHIDPQRLDEVLR